MEFMRMSLNASLLIVVIVVVRALVINKLTKKTFVALWGVALCRLLIPISLPSRLSIFSLIGKIQDMLTGAPVAAAPNGIDQFTQAGTLLSTNTVADGIGSTFAITPALIATAIWLAGAIAGVLFFTITHFRSRREYKTALPVDNAFIAAWLQKHMTKRRIPIRQSDKITAPLTYGVITPVILLPKTMDWDDTQQLSYVLMHEYVHIRRFDVALKWLFAAALCLHWFNPLVWVMYVLANRDIELSCDETVIRSFGETAKSSYALALIGLEEKRSQLAPLNSYFAKNAIEERIRSIMKFKKTSIAGLMIALTLVAGTTVAFATSAPVDGDAYKATSGSTVLAVAMDGENFKYSEDGGNSWMSEEEYNRANPAHDVVWWTYDEYKAWLEQEKISLQDIIGSSAWNGSDGWFTWTQEKVDEAIRMYEQTLESIKNGGMISKSVDGQDDIFIATDSSTGNSVVEKSYGASIVLNDGTLKVFGPFDTQEALLAQLEPYCDAQVKAGTMTQAEADELLSHYR